MIVRSRRLETLLICCLALVSRWAHANPSTAEISAARHAFESAVALEGAGQWAEATLQLQRALAVKDTPGLRFHLAHCEIEQGQLLEAAADYDRASELIKKGARAQDVQKLLASASAALKPRIPSLTVELPSDVLAAVPSLDGKVVPPSELALGLPLNPGQHELTVSASGRRTFQRSLTLKEGDSVQVRADLPLAPQPDATRAASAVQAPPIDGSSYEVPREARLARSPVKLYLMVGESVVTAVGLVIGLAYHSAASSAADRVSNDQGLIDRAGPNCGSPSTGEVLSACADLRSSIDDHDRAATLSTVGFVAAGAGAAAFVTTWFAYPSAHVASSSMTIQPVAGLGHLGLVGRFRACAFPNGLAPRWVTKSRELVDLSTSPPYGSRPM